MVEASEFATLVNVDGVKLMLALFSSSTIGTLGFPSEISLTATWSSENITNGTLNSQPT